MEVFRPYKTYIRPINYMSRLYIYIYISLIISGVSRKTKPPRKDLKEATDDPRDHSVETWLVTLGFETWGNPSILWTKLGTNPGP